MAAEETDEALELATKLQNPVAAPIGVPFQSNFEWGGGHGSDGFKYTLNTLASIYGLHDTAEFYNAATANCTTTITTHVKNIGVAFPFDWRVIANGRLPELLYEHGVIDVSPPLAEVERTTLVNERAQAAARIRLSRRAFATARCVRRCWCSRWTRRHQACSRKFDPAVPDAALAISVESRASGGHVAA